jgi:hypothetical protein
MKEAGITRTAFWALEMWYACWISLQAQWHRLLRLKRWVEEWFICSTKWWEATADAGVQTPPTPTPDIGCNPQSAPFTPHPHTESSCNPVATETSFKHLYLIPKTATGSDPVPIPPTVHSQPIYIRSILIFQVVSSAKSRQHSHILATPWFRPCLLQFTALTIQYDLHEPLSSRYVISIPF